MRQLTSLLIALLFAQFIMAQEAPKTFQNPIIPGFHPDPSICRVNDDYYLVNSSFNYFPGIPVFHSKDLVNWKPIGYVLSRPSQLNMLTPGNGGGIWAPTIRYHEGKFYVIVTCKQCKNNCNCGFNFYVSTTDPAGEWSDPTWVKDAPGIDPTIFWDDDGKVYYVGSTHAIGGPRRWANEDRIYIAEMNIETGELISEPVILTSGHAADAAFAEGPHIYKIKGKYLLMLAEGGTWNSHAVTCLIGDKVTGPYTALKNNPVLTHRHLGNSTPITTLGHADLVQTQKGEWWSVMLGCRPIEGSYYLGRETFLTPVSFEGYTPVFNPGVGQVLLEDQRPDLPWTPVANNYNDDFDGDILGWQWNFLLTPQSQWYQLEKGQLVMETRPESVKKRCNPSFIARRLEHHQFEVSARVAFDPQKDEEEAGIVVIQNENFHYRLVLGRHKGKKCIKLFKVYNQNRKVHHEELVGMVSYKKKEVVLGLKVHEHDFEFFYGEGKTASTKIGATQDGRVLTSKASGGFIGAYVGMYTSSNGSPSKNKAAFDYFNYLPAANN